MVSFQCEGCGDVQTKKKLDSHRNQCHAPFTCIDCMTTFHGYDYKAHTSCMTEAQKYEGHLYREKPNKASKRKSVSILEPNENNALVPRKATVEDDLELDVPPHVPTPPPAVPDAESVFDFLVDDDTPDTPQIQFATEREEMFMKSNAPSVFGGSRPTSRNEFRNKEEEQHSKEYQENGFSYGAEPIHPRPAHANASTITLEYMTPAAKAARAKLERGVPESAGHSRQNSNSEKKRKRAPTDDHSVDVVMPDAPGTIVRSVIDAQGSVAHSGLTGGLQRMLSDEKDWGRSRSPSLSPDPDRNRQALGKLKPVKPVSTKHREIVEPQSPLKRSRRSKEEDAGLGISIKGRAGRVMSAINGALSVKDTESAVGTTGKTSSSRRRASSSDNQERDKSHTRERDSERRDRKKHKVTRHNGTSSANVRMEHKSKRRQESAGPDLSKSKSNGKASQKAIEYHASSHRDGSRDRHMQSHSPSDSDDRAPDNQMVVFGTEERTKQKCEDFLEYITKGPGSSKGYSIDKVLKRYHRDSEIVRETAKREEEKDLWKGLRLKRNDRGEVVVFFA